MNTETRVTWAMRLVLLAFSILLFLQNEPLMAVLPLLLATGIEWRRTNQPGSTSDAG